MDVAVACAHLCLSPLPPAVFTPEQKENVGTALRRISDALMRQRACSRRPLIIYNARVPIAKVSGCPGLACGHAGGRAECSHCILPSARQPGGVGQAISILPS